MQNKPVRWENRLEATGKLPLSVKCNKISILNFGYHTCSSNSKLLQIYSSNKGITIYEHYAGKRASYYSPSKITG